VCVSAVDIGNKPILISHKKVGGKFEKKSRARDFKQIGGTQEKKKYFKVKKERKIKGKVEAGVCMCVARINRRIYCSWENANGFGNPCGHVHVKENANPYGRGNDHGCVSASCGEPVTNFRVHP